MRVGWKIFWIAVVVGLFVTGIALIAIHSDDEDPSNWRRQERQSCIDRRGTVQENSEGLFTGCLISYAP